MFYSSKQGNNLSHADQEFEDEDLKVNIKILIFIIFKFRWQKIATG